MDNQNIITYDVGALTSEDGQLISGEDNYIWDVDNSTITPLTPIEEEEIIDEDMLIEGEGEIIDSTDLTQDSINPPPMSLDGDRVPIKRPFEIQNRPQRSSVRRKGPSNPY